MTLAVMLTMLLAQVPTPPPSAITTSCPFKPAHVDSAIQPVIPEGVKDSLAHPITTEVKVTVAADGSLKGVTLWKSSGYKSVDLEVIHAARSSGYSPTMVNCKPVDGDYIWTTTITPN